MAKDDNLFKYGTAHITDMTNVAPEVTHLTAFINEGTSLVSILEVFLMLHEDEKYKDIIDIKIAKLLLDFANINKN